MLSNSIFSAISYLGHLFSFDETNSLAIPRRDENSYLGSSAGAIGTDTESRSPKRHRTRKSIAKKKLPFVDALSEKPWN